MGNCISGELIANVGSTLIKEFFKQSLYSQILEAIAAPKNCGGESSVERALKCQMMTGIKEAYEYILVFVMALMVLVGILIYIAYGKTKPIIRQIVNKNQNSTMVQRIDLETARPINSERRILPNVNSIGNQQNEGRIWGDLPDA